VLIRQAHPGEERGRYTTDEHKAESAAAYQRDEGIPWPVLVDTLDGTVHRAYGGLADPSYLLDADGRVAFYALLTHAPTLKRAIDELLASGGRGAPVAGGTDRQPHLLAPMVLGWNGLRRGGRRAVVDLELAAPGAASGTFLGHLARPVLRPLALRIDPLPAPARVAAAAAPLLALLAWRRAGNGRAEEKAPIPGDQPRV
jgi:hypothetical protein